ncbi:hypothetical protein QTP86_010396 [Hemibagrus guttatus]|nr:hypothetical protein QTP86_010396 [Hemibagrus guttatus]
MEAEPVFKVPTKRKKKSRSKSNKQAKKHESDVEESDGGSTDSSWSQCSQSDEREVVHTAAEILAFLKNTKGKSYGLLGPSGCGKTTLLKCIVGTLKISRGHISVLGKPPRFPGHEVPGRMVGYMPQDIALYNEFTISDTLWFFGRIHGLSSQETRERMKFLIEFLDLPQKDSLVRKLRKT